MLTLFYDMYGNKLYNYNMLNEVQGNYTFTHVTFFTTTCQPLGKAMEGDNHDRQSRQSQVELVLNVVAQTQ
jgi:hypothetical protein